MKKYNDFKEYMEDVYYDEIFNKNKGLVYAHKDSFESDTVYSVSYAEPYDIHVSGVTFKEQDNGLMLEQPTAPLYMNAYIGTGIICHGRTMKSLINQGIMGQNGA